MRIAILSTSRFIFSTRRIVEAAKERGHDVSVINTLACAISMVDGRYGILHHGQELDAIDVVIPRIGTSLTEYGLSVVRQFELMGVPVVNGNEAISLSRDKLRAAQFMAQHGLPTPPTVALRDPANMERLVEELGGPPLIVKPVRGTQGVGVVLVESMSSIRSISEMMWGQGQNFIIQKFIAESAGHDIRALVVGDRVVASMRRRGQAGEFRSNLHRGGKAEQIELPPAFEDLALRAARAIGLQVAGVDLLEAASGPLLLEINSSPGLSGIERCTGLDIAQAIVARAEEIGGGGPVFLPESGGERDYGDEEEDDEDY